MEHAEGSAEELKSVVRERSATIDQSIGYLEKLATNYARLSRKTERERCDLNQIVRQVAAGARGTARIETVLSDGAVVDADPVSLRRIIENLVDNAIDSLNGSGAVTLETQVIRDGPFVAPRVRLIVADTGVGMNDIQRARIFDDFYTTKPDGSGLGLSIVRRLVMDMGGTVKAEGAPGEGTRLVVDLPATK
jgi:signal transduction histidine kinase